MPTGPVIHRRATPLLLLGLAAAPVAAQSLRGSPASMNLQNRIAHEHSYTYLETTSQVRRFVDKGYLVRVRETSSLGFGNVSFPYARPQVRTFLNRLAAQYQSACGERLVVTSLTRPQSRQPRNASRRSVHPTGMAMDLRVSRSRRCRSWLEDTLLSLEKQHLLEATREHHPPHYHVALFPTRYENYVENLTGGATRVATAAPSNASSGSDTMRYRVRTGDSLWAIAHDHGLTVDEIKMVNNLRGSRIYAGQLLELPAR